MVSNAALQEAEEGLREGGGGRREGEGGGERVY